MFGVEFQKVKSIIKGRPVLIMLHGKSIENLEQYIYEIGDYDICYASVNYFPIMEQFILSNIGKKLDIVYDSTFLAGDCRQDFDAKCRVPRLREFLSRKDDNIWVTTKKTIQTITFESGFESFALEFNKKFFLLNKLDISQNVPNSSLLIIGTCILAGASKIILCGLDGYTGDNHLETYYKPELQLKDKKWAGTDKVPHLKEETRSFNLHALDILKSYTNRIPPIINCSPNSQYGIFKRIDYPQLKGEIK